jgi:hypothetical protein
MVITTKLKQDLAATLNGVSYTKPSHIAWGDGDTQAVVGDTELENELERNEITDSNLTGRTFEISCILTTDELAGSTIKEVGLLNSSSGGDLSIRETFSDLEKTSNFEVETIFVITID